MPNGIDIIEKEKLKKINNKFHKEKLKVLIDKIKEGKRGWDNEEYYDTILHKLMLKVIKVVNNNHTKKDFIDISSYSMFLWGLEDGQNKGK